jgi:hypothetical protein
MKFLLLMGWKFWLIRDMILTIQKCSPVEKVVGEVAFEHASAFGQRYRA